MSVIVVGEVNPHDSACALCLCHPGSSGHRLMTIMGLTPQRYLSLRRVNLCRDRWDRKEARRRAGELDGGPGPLVLLGRRVAEAFARRVPMFTVAVGSYIKAVDPFDGTITMTTYDTLVIPHPSGRSREWNDPKAKHAARELLRRVAPDVPWGEA